MTEPNLGTSNIGIFEHMNNKVMALGKNINFKNGMAAFSNIMDVIPSLDKNINSADESMSNIRGSVNKALLSGAAGPWGMLAGGVSSIIDKTGGFTDASQGLGNKTDTANKIASLLIPGAGWAVGKTNKFKVDEGLKQSSGFSGLVSKAETAAGNAGAKLLFGKKKANALIKDTAFKQNLVVDLLDQNKLLKDASATNAQNIAFGNQLKKQGGFQPIAVGKKGMKLDKKEAQKILSRRGHFKASTEEENLEQSLIPGGALHAHRNHLKDKDEDIGKAVTAKGVPVVTFEEGGEVEQHAEIERGEIIFRLDVSKELEKLWKDGSEEAMIKAGKLIAEEVINNTKDKSGEYEINN